MRVWREDSAPASTTSASAAKTTKKLEKKPKFRPCDPYADEDECAQGLVCWDNPGMKDQGPLCWSLEEAAGAILGELHHRISVHKIRMSIYPETLHELLEHALLEDGPTTFDKWRDPVDRYDESGRPIAFTDPWGNGLRYIRLSKSDVPNSASDAVCSRTHNLCYKLCSNGPDGQENTKDDMCGKK